MSKTTAVRSKGVVAQFSEAFHRLSQAGDYAIVVRGVPRSIVLSCPDGCGDIVTVNLDRRAGPAWRAYLRSDTLTVYPSVWRETGCEAHFIIWNDHILWCGLDESPWSLARNEEQLAIVLKHLFDDRFQHYETIAQTIDAIPWDIYLACRDLVRAGRAVQDAEGRFKRAT